MQTVDFNFHVCPIITNAVASIKKFASSLTCEFRDKKKNQELPLAAPSASAAPWQHSLSLCLTFDTDRSSSDLFKLNSAGGTGIYNYRRIYFHRWSCSQLTRCSGYYARQNWAFTSCSHLKTGSAGDQSMYVDDE